MKPNVITNDGLVISSQKMVLH